MCHTSVPPRGAAGPWELSPAGKSTGGKKAEGKKGSKVSLKQAPSPHQSRFLPEAPPGCPPPWARGDSPLPGARQPEPGMAASAACSNTLKNVLLHWARGLPAACKHDR